MLIIAVAFLIVKIKLGNFHCPFCYFIVNELIFTSNFYGA